MKNHLADFWSGRTVRETFDKWWKLDPETGCHEWQRSLAGGGYGQLNIGGPRPQGAHRFAWERVNGPVSDGLHVLHSCDNRRCVNVDHLFLGTNDDNIRDMHSKGRARGGGRTAERHPMVKLSWDKVRDIRARYLEGDTSQRRLGSEFGVTQTTIGHIVRHEIWRGDGTNPTTRADYKAPQKELRRTVLMRFDELVQRQDSGCVVWTGWKDRNGYGKFRASRRHISAHRFSFERAFGPIAEGFVVRHSCDRPDCVNPEHLFLGTQQDNIRDMVSRGRQRGAVGERNTKAKLKFSDVKLIREYYALGQTQAAIAARFSVSQSSVSGIVVGQTWREVT